MNKVKDDRSFVGFVLLSLITLGIYDLFFYHKLSRDINVICKDDKMHTPGVLMLLLLSLVTCGLYSFVWVYGVGNRLKFAGDRYNVEIKEGGMMIMLLMLVGSLVCGIGYWIGIYHIIDNTNTIADAYNKSVA